MKKFSVLFLLLVLQAFSFVQVKAQEKKRAFEVPSKYVSFLLLNDPKCPLQLSNPRVLAYNSRDLDFYYTILNSSDKSVKSFQIKEFDAFVNPSYEATPNSTATDEFSFLPYESFSTLRDENKFEITALDEKRAAEFKLSENRRRTYVVIVTKVELYDGTTYDATQTYSQIKKFTEQIETEELLADDEAPKLTMEEKQTKLHNFIIEKVQKNK